jgi:dihydropyrimidinase
MSHAEEASMDLIIRGGTIVTATDTYAADIGIVDGKVAQIGGDFAAGDARGIDAEGKLVLPGAIDVHTHLDAPSQGAHTVDDFLSGTVAAACGGTTTVIDFCTQVRGQTLLEALELWHAKARDKAVVDYGFHMIVVDFSATTYDELAQLPGLGVTSFKLFMAYKGQSMVNDDVLIAVLDQARRHGALVLVHAENGEATEFLRHRLVQEGKTEPKFHASSRPPRVEAEATARAIALAEIVAAPIYIVHVSCGEALEEVTRGRARGVDVLAETCSQYLYLTEDVLDESAFEGAKYVFTPPPRQAHQPPLLWDALAAHDLQVVSSDHSPFNFVGGKDRGRDDFTQIPNGGPGIEERPVLVFQGVHDGRLSLNRFVDLVATAPAKIFGLYPSKGTIAIGSDADLAIWDPDIEWTLGASQLHHRVDYTMYEGTQVRGAPQTVLRRGEVIVRDREFVGQPGTGQFLPRKPYRSCAGL